MTCKTFVGMGRSLEEATKDAEKQCNEHLKALTSNEVVGLSTNHYFDERHQFAITVVYQRIGTSVSKQLEAIAKNLTLRGR